MPPSTTASRSPRAMSASTSSSVSDLAGFDGGRWWVQDLAASLPARLIPVDASDVLDLCAAPGGKTMQLAAAGHRVTAVDASKSRLGTTARESCSGRISSARPRPGRCADVEAGARSSTRSCSTRPARRPAPSAATPRCSTAPAPRIIAESAELQARLLARAAAWLKPGGTLVYSVCSLEPEEGEEVVTGFLARQSRFRASTGRAGPARLRHAATTAGWIRILPGLLEEQGGLDGFFMARLVRAQLIASNRRHGRSAHRPVDPVRRLRPARRGSARDRRGRRRLDPHRRHGRPFRAQPHHRPGRGEGAPPAHAPSRSTSI